MSATLEHVATSPRIDYKTVAPGALRALFGVEQYVRTTGLEHSLVHLIKLRASIINGCAYCVDMHTKDARVEGETEQRLYGVAVWHETPYFTPRERAALAWTDSLTNIAQTRVPDAAFDEVKEHFTDEEVVALTMAVIAINSWNRIAVALRQPVGTYVAQRRSSQPTVTAESTGDQR